MYVCVCNITYIRSIHSGDSRRYARYLPESTKNSWIFIIAVIITELFKIGQRSIAYEYGLRLSFRIITKFGNVQ